MIVLYGYAVKKDGRYLGFNPKSAKKQYYKRPKFPVVYGSKSVLKETYGHLGEAVKVKLTMEEVK